MTRIKVCGLTEERDAIEAVHLGVDAIGFVFWRRSPRFIPPRDAGRIASKLPPFIAKVGVFVDEPADAVMDAVYAAGLTALQFHGDEPPDYCRRFMLSWYKAFRVGPKFEPESLAAYSCTTYLLDGAAGELRGGSGVNADWERARASTSYGRIILAGGLVPETVRSGIEAVRPYAVDVSSGVEFAPGKKDIDRLESFVRAVRSADAAIARESSS